MKFSATILGSGTSQGIPVIACDCHVCTSQKVEDNRLRCSVLLEIEGKNYVIDAGPDFRQQMLKFQVKNLEAVLFTHEHKDHMAGLDDVRAFNFKESRDMDIYCTKAVEEALRREYHYAFEEDKYPGIPQLNIITIENEPFRLSNTIPIVPVEVMHYFMPVLGFRIGDFAYITDAKTVSAKEIEKLKGVKVLIVNALRKEPHISHFNLEEALHFIQEVKPEKAYLTHISHLFGTHAEIESELPENVFAAYDGLKFDFE
ncbi:MBL fold metallo-hydrolase [Fluviicola taffensis]|uniref:Metal-dependent hydrolase n=1 Tax=Fluviicola taffensis (strain DSM 16823 / NCIMB 13979 / RW262) TaxID=755732 RepID=F2IAA3_FLUTR|nr:MBL fold metallo-hydrolase [Fluviicola taffensis]AEA42038.1 metal-dependent hydrolase [Fluviicola taffensis DSM 16823]